MPIPGVDFSKCPADHGRAARPAPADYFALTRILVVPSVWEEPFGRVAAEAMINAIPPLVSNRGSLPHVVGGDFSAGGGGTVLPIPEWMTQRHDAGSRASRRSSLGIEAVCALWDDEALYESVGARARRIAESERIAKTSLAGNMSVTSPRSNQAVIRSQIQDFSD